MQGGVQGPVVIGSTTNQGGFFKGDKGGTFSYSDRFPQAMQMMQEAGTFGLEGLKKLLGEQFNFAPIAAQARKNFSQTTIPSIAERFASLGTGGSQRSSAFPQLLSQAGSDLDSQLAAMQEQFGLQERGLNSGIYRQMFEAGTQPMWNTGYRQGSPSGVEKFLYHGINNAAQAAGKYFGGM